MTNMKTFLPLIANQEPNVMLFSGGQRPLGKNGITGEKYPYLKEQIPKTPLNMKES